MSYNPPLYPGEIPTEANIEIVFDDLDMCWARHHNCLNKELRAVMIELGLLPKGSYTTVRARLDDLEQRITNLENA
jgi:hypothetical protein